MIYALNEQGEKIAAEECLIGTNPVCPICNSNVIPKRGDIITWHFAHQKDSDCDTWSEGETEWHKTWKDKAPKNCREVTLENHRADIFIPFKDRIERTYGKVIELQNSPISIQEVKERDEFYGIVVWIINCTKIQDHISITQKDNYFTFRWRWYKKSFQNAMNLHLDLGDFYNQSEMYRTVFPERKDTKYILQVKKIYENGRGYGHLLSHEEFCRINKLTNKEEP